MKNSIKNPQQIGICTSARSKNPFLNLSQSQNSPEKEHENDNLYSLENV